MPGSSLLLKVNDNDDEDDDDDNNDNDTNDDNTDDVAMAQSMS